MANIKLSALTAAWSNVKVFGNFENIVGSGYDDTLTGDANANNIQGGVGKDTFVISRSNGEVLIKDFSINDDKINLSAFTGIKNLSELKNKATFIGNTCQIVLENGKTLTLAHINLADLVDSNFVFDTSTQKPVDCWKDFFSNPGSCVAYHAGVWTAVGGVISALLVFGYHKGWFQECCKHTPKKNQVSPNTDKVSDKKQEALDIMKDVMKDTMQYATAMTMIEGEEMLPLKMMQHENVNSMQTNIENMIENRNNADNFVNHHDELTLNVPLHIEQPNNGTNIIYHDGL
ncbi:hypothetical protein MIDIC_530008 [Alphaproteobacteria bacterium]